MNVLSLFDGMRCGVIAFERAGIKVDNYWSSEVDKYAIKVADHNYPQFAEQKLGDVRYITEKMLDSMDIDIIIGGSPCQSFSFSGKRNGMTTKNKVEITTLEQYLKLKEQGFEFEGQSYLFWEYIRILRHVKPKYFLLENVKMSKKWEKVLNDAIGCDPICINSNLVSAQNRKRLYWTNIPNISQPIDRNIFWGDIREKGVNKFYYTEKALQWMAKHSQDKNKKLRIWQDDEKAQMVEASHFKNYSSQRFFGICDYPSDEECVGAMLGQYVLDEGGNKKTRQFIEFRHDERSNAIITVTKDNVVVPFTLPNKIPSGMFFLRYITPLECERLQTVPDGYTECVSSTQRYKMLGNGWTIDVIAHILKGLKENDVLNEV